VISMYKWSRIKSMRARGKSIRRIAKELGISRNTVRRYVRQGGPPRYEKRAKECKRVTEGFEERVKELLKGEYIGTEIFERLKGEGYRGSLSSIYRLIKAVREDEEKGIEVTSRFETAPGEQMQYDWKEWNLVVKGKKLKVYIHQLILGFSRKKFFTFSVSIKTADVIRCKWPIKMTPYRTIILTPLEEMNLVGMAVNKFNSPPLRLRYEEAHFEGVGHDS